MGMSEDRRGVHGKKMLVDSNKDNLHDLVMSQKNFGLV